MSGITTTTAPATGRVDVELARSSGEWDAYVHEHPLGSADHVWDWQAVIDDAFGHSPRYLMARRGGRAAGVLPLVLFKSALFGRAVVSLPFLNDGGILADDAAAADALLSHAIDIARGFGARHVELRHRARQFPALPYRQHKLGHVRTLPATAEHLWETLDRKVRNLVRKAQKSALATAEGGAELVPEFYAVFAENMRDLGTPVYGRRLFEAVLDAHASRARVFVVRHGARPVAAGIAVAGPHRVLVPWASSLRSHRHLAPNMLLYWKMLEWSINRRAPAFDFGRSSPGGGTHQFKLQWGAVEEPLHWEYVMLDGRTPPDQGPANPTYRRAVRWWTRLPLPVANLIGPHIVRHIP